MKRVRETAQLPAQVYLDDEEQRRLERLAALLETTKSDILRRGMRALEQQLLSPNSHPALQVIGLVEKDGTETSYDPAVEHDRLLTESEEASWRLPAPKRRKRAR